MRILWYLTAILFAAAWIVSWLTGDWLMVAFNLFGATASYTIFRLLEEREEYLPLLRVVATQKKIEAALDQIHQERVDRVVERLIGRNV